MLKLNYDLIGKEIYGTTIVSMETEKEEKSDLVTISFINNNKINLLYVHWFNNTSYTNLYIISRNDYMNILTENVSKIFIKNKTFLIETSDNATFTFLKTENNNLSKDILRLLHDEYYKFVEIVPEN